MSLVLSTPILGNRPAFDEDDILDRMAHPDEKDRAFFDSLIQWCDVAGIDPAVPAAQFLLETADGTSIRWTRDLNASGMGIVSDGTAQPFKITSVDESARLFVQCLYSLVRRKAHPDIPLTGAVLSWFNSVWLPKVQSRAMPNVTKVADLGLRYIENGDSRATWSWEKGTGSMDAYGIKLGSRLKEFYPNLPDCTDDPPVDTPSTPEEPVANPETLKPNTKYAYVEKQQDRQGFNYGNRGPIVGLFVHETQGHGSGEWYSEFFSCPDGERCDDALVDYFIDRKGQLYEFQDPFDTDRIPWGSGGKVQNWSDPVGIYINNNYGNVNDSFACVEMEKYDEEHLTAAQIDTVGRLGAFVLAKSGKRKREFWSLPNHASVFTSTNCSQYADDRVKFEAVCDRELAAYYAGTTPAPGPDPDPPKPVDIIPGVDLAVAKRLFGSAKGEDGRSYAFNPDGPASKLWIERGKATGEWPALANVWVYGDKRKYLIFADGSVIFDPPGEDTEPRWLKEEAA